MMESFYRNWQQGMNKPEALRQAQLALRKLPQYRHPYYWAPLYKPITARDMTDNEKRNYRRLRK
ncbi:MAG: CHAT domain-containing protein [Nitrospinae bacterium]|nr:CHAT domain-containing protein [Nitrospinota bacterium]